MQLLPGDEQNYLKFLLSLLLEQRLEKYSTFDSDPLRSNLWPWYAKASTSKVR